MKGIHFNPENGCRRWFAYFDLLGTTDLIKSGKTHKVFSAYQTASEKLEGGTHNSKIHSHHLIFGKIYNRIDK